VIVLDPTAGPAFKTGGNGTVTVRGGSIMVDSNAGNGLSNNGNGTVTTTPINPGDPRPPINVVGGYSGSGFTPTRTTGAAAIEDPLKVLPEPSRPASGTVTPVGNNTYILTPGSYDGGDPKLKNFGNGDTVIFKQASTNSAGGIYY